MPNKCSAFGCFTGYHRKKEEPSSACEEHIARFHFPLKKEELLQKWTRFVGIKEWKPTAKTVLCEKHFEENYIKRGKRTTLKWELNPVPTVQSSAAAKRPASFPLVTPLRKAPKIRNILPDQKPTFDDQDLIGCFSQIDVIKHCPAGYQVKKNESSVLFYRINFDENSGFPSISAGIRIDDKLHVKLQCNGLPVPLPTWFTAGRDAKLTRYSMLGNLPAYIANQAENNLSPILEELRRRQHMKPKGRPPYSPQLLRYALLLRYSSPQTYRILLEQFPLPSFSLLQKLRKGGVNSIKAAKMLREEQSISSDIILMADEMYLQKSTQYHGGEYIGADSDGNLFSGVTVFMIVGLKQSVPVVVRASPETGITGKWLSNELLTCVKDLLNSGFKIRGLVTDNHSANVAAFKILLRDNIGDGKHYFQLSKSDHRTYVFFDSVHIIKNIRNNLLNARKFVFPEFNFEVNGHRLISAPGYVTWQDIHRIYDNDQKVASNLRKAPKLTYKALHPGNNKQNVNLALAIFHETTIAASKSYFPKRQDMANFLDLILTWWTIANSNNRHNANRLGNAIIKDDGKLDFFEKFAQWLEEWFNSPDYCLTKQTNSALVLTLKSQAMLIRELLEDGYEYVLTRRLQSDPIENRFSQYRQMSGGRFLVSLREVQSTEKALICRSLLKAGIDFWKEEELDNETGTEDLKAFMGKIEEHETELMEISLDEDTEEVAHTVAGYVARKLLHKLKCDECCLRLIASSSRDDQDYLSLLSRGGLLIPSDDLSSMVCSLFAQVDYINSFILSNSVQQFAEHSLMKYAPNPEVSCNEHKSRNRKSIIRTVINIFFNNMQKLASDNVRKEAVAQFKQRQRKKE